MRKVKFNPLTSEGYIHKGIITKYFMNDRDQLRYWPFIITKRELNQQIKNFYKIHNEIMDMNYGTSDSYIIDGIKTLKEIYAIRFSPVGKLLYATEV